jgi:ATP-binding cassette, subfamily F, member 3
MIESRQVPDCAAYTAGRTFNVIAMPVLTLTNIHHAYGSRIVLDGATLSIEPCEKIGLVGRNGSGKTTLMKAMLGSLKPDSGSVALQRGARVGYLSQDPSFDPEETVRDASEGAFAELHALHLKAHELYDRMASAQGAELDRLLRQQAQIDGQIEAAGGYAIDHKIDATLHGLGFTDEQFSLRVKNLSGGQKNRLGLARLLLEEPDVLLLDEPTNHLDIAGRQWLEEFLAAEYPGAVVLVSHDRWLLDRVAHRIIDVERGSIAEYPGNYEKYVELRRERQLTAARVFDKQQDRVRQEEQFIRRYKAGQRSKQARGRETRLERFKQDIIERPIELDVMKLRLPKAPRSGEQVAVAEGIGKRYGDLVLFHDFDLTIMRGDRIGIIGPNGIGKTTLVRCLLGEIEPDAGRVRLGSRLNIGYYRQTHEHLDLSYRVWQYLQSVIVGEDGQARASEQQARDLAGAFLFSGDEQEKALGDLSGGERSRAVLAGLVASAKNLLVLDEPSNHLDIPSAERLEYALSSDGGYEGTLLLITHDRALLQATCEKLLVFEGEGRVRLFQGTYLEWREFASRRPEPASADAAPKPVRAPPVREQPRPSKRAMEEAEAGMADLSQRIAAIDARMAGSQVFTDGDRCRDLQRERAALARELQRVEAEWLRMAELSEQ